MKKAVVAIITFMLTLLIIISAYLTLQAKPVHEIMENGEEPQESEKASLPQNPNVDNAEVAENQQGDTSKDSLDIVENSYCRLDQPCEPLSESKNSVNIIEKTNMTIEAPPPDRFVSWTEELPYVDIPRYTTKKWTKIPKPPPDL